MICIHGQGAPKRLIVLHGNEASPPIGDASFLPPCDRKDLSVNVRELSAWGVGGVGPTDILVLDLGNGGGQWARFSEVMRHAADRGAQSIVLTPEPPASLPDLLGVRFWVTGMRAVEQGERGAAVLGNADRVMNRLAEQMKRRGAVLSSRTAACLLGLPERKGADPGAAARLADVLCGLEKGRKAFLYASGMSAITAVFDILRNIRMSRRVNKSGRQPC